MLMTYSFLLKEKAQIFIFFPKGKSSIVVMSMHELFVLWLEHGNKCFPESTWNSFWR